MHPKYKNFLSQDLPQQLRALSPAQTPNFGLMTPHHMVEHLIFVTKTLSKRKGEPEGEMTKSQRYFRNFIESGCPFEHRPKEGATLNDLRTASMEEAIQILEGAIQHFYSLFESNPHHKSYNPMMGEFDLAEIESFHYQHGKWHLHQFGMIEHFEALSLQE